MRFISSDVVSVHTFSLLTVSWVAPDRATEHNHTHQTETTETTTTTDSGSNLDRRVLYPPTCEYQIYTNNVNSLAYETVREVQPNIPLASKDINIPLGSKNSNIPLNVCKYSTEKTYSTREIGTQTARKCYSESSTLLPDYKKTFLSSSGIAPSADVLCLNISVALPTILSSSYDKV